MDGSTIEVGEIVVRATLQAMMQGEQGRAVAL